MWRGFKLLVLLTLWKKCIPEDQESRDSRGFQLTVSGAYPTRLLWWQSFAKAFSARSFLWPWLNESEKKTASIVEILFGPCALLVDVSVQTNETRSAVHWPRSRSSCIPFKRWHQQTSCTLVVKHRKWSEKLRVPSWPFDPRRRL